MLFTYDGPHEAVDIPALNLHGIAKGQEFEVTGDAAKALLDQPDFTRTDKPVTKKES